MLIGSIVQDVFLELNKNNNLNRYKFFKMCFILDLANRRFVSTVVNAFTFFFVNVQMNK